MRKKRVMIVDDDKEFLEELQETLFLNGYEVIKVNDPHQVLDSAGNNKPDIILLDLKMDHFSGFEIADDLRRLPEFGRSRPHQSQDRCRSTL